MFGWFKKSSNVKSSAQPPQEAIEEAKHRPNGWVYQIEGSYGPNDAVPPEAVQGAWKVDGNGKIVGEFIANPNFGQAATTRPPMPSLQSVSFDISGLEHQRDEQGRRIWFTRERDAAVSLSFFDKPPDLSGDLRTAEQLRQFYSSPLVNSPAKLVEVGVVNLGGCKAVRLIIKVPQQPHGMTYYGSFTIPFRDFSFLIKVECPEQGMTGVRETVLFEKLMAVGKISVTDPPRIDGEWNPDDEKYDADFPSHPISKLRRRLKGIAESCVIDPAIRNKPSFPLPDARH